MYKEKDRFCLQEFSSLSDVPLTSEDVRTLSTTHRKHVQCDRIGNTFTLHAGPWVGTIHLKDKAIVVQPKVPIKNLFYMLIYAFDLPELKYLESLVTENASDLYEILVLVLVKWTEQIVKKGLYRSYFLVEEYLPEVRGKIVAYRSSLQQAKLFCSYDRLSYSTLENKILRATIFHVLKQDIDDAVKIRCRVLVRLLCEIEWIDLSPDLFSRISYHRLNYQYRKIMALCCEIYRASLFQQEAGDREFSGFMVNINRLFEEFGWYLSLSEEP